MISAGMLIGGYRLEERIGAGGLGQVWRALSARGDVVALKLLGALQAGESTRHLKREVYALARLDHPHIARVFDMGVWRHPHIAARFPFIVMEHVRGVRMSELAGDVLTWRAWAPLLGELLDALAHAHALGVVHRDLKPDNVLVDQDERGRRRVKLVDFGIARIISHEDGSLGVTMHRSTTDGLQISGTPRYMAPEQIDPEYGPIGPWTDIYAVGCMVWRLISGGVGPFDGDLMRVLLSHLSTQPGPFRPVIAVPNGVERWLRWLMTKDVQRRCRSAVIAAAALQHLEELPAAAPMPEEPTALSWDVTEETTLSSSRSNIDALFSARRAARPSQHGGPLTRLTISEEWDVLIQREGAWRDVTLQPTLWRKRNWPLAGRRAERDVLWTQLVEAVRRVQARHVTLEGEAGVGKSRLLGWLIQHVQELGAAQVLSLQGDTSQPEEVALREALISAVAWRGAAPPLIELELQRLYRALDVPSEAASVEIAALMAIMRGDASGHSVQERHDAIARFIGRLAQRQPLVLAVEGAEDNGDLRRFMSFAMHHDAWRRAPILCVMTAPPSLEPLLTSGGLRLELGPLTPALQARALMHMLPMDEGAASLLISRTQGSLKLAIAHLHDWIERGELRAQYDGLLFVESRLLNEVAPSFAQLWTRKCAEWEADYGAVQIMALALGAILGHRVDHDRWRACCQAAGVSGEALLERALDSSGARQLSQNTWCFVQGELRDALLEWLARQGRWEEMHAICAEELARENTFDPAAFETQGRLWREAKRPERAAVAWIDAADRYLERGEEAALARVVTFLEQAAQHSLTDTASLRIKYRIDAA